MRRRGVGLTAAICVAAAAGSFAQRRDVFVQSRDDAAINYSKGDTDNPVDRLNKRLAGGTTKLTLDPANGYLKSMLDALGISPTSQVLVFSQTSFQAERIGFHNPRAIFFNDNTAVAWVRGSNLLEVAVQDRTQGGVF